MTWDDTPRRSNPIGDFRIGAAMVYLNRSLTEFEKIVIASGLARPNEFEVDHGANQAPYFEE